MHVACARMQRKPTNKETKHFRHRLDDRAMVACVPLTPFLDVREKKETQRLLPERVLCATSRSLTEVNRWLLLWSESTKVQRVRKSERKRPFWKTQFMYTIVSAFGSSHSDVFSNLLLSACVKLGLERPHALLPAVE
eukprot:679431-Amphidinium_carterae.1